MRQVSNHSGSGGHIFSRDLHFREMMHVIFKKLSWFRFVFVSASRNKMNDLAPSLLRVTKN